MSELPTELRTLVRRYGDRVLDDADGLRATLDDFLDEGTASPGEVNLLVDAIRFGSLTRLRMLLGQGADPGAATMDVAESLARRRGGDAQSAYWACATLGYAADLLPGLLLGGPQAWSAQSETHRSPQPAGDTAVGPTGQAGPASAVQPAPGPGPHPQGPVGPPPQPAASLPSAPRPSRSRRWLVAAVALVLVAGGAVAYLVTRGEDASSPTDRKQTVASADNGVAAIEPQFGHFGTNLTKVLSACVNAALPGDKPAFNCTFKPPNDSFSLRLTEQDSKVQDTNGVLPGFITTPDRNTIVEEQNLGAAGGNTYHAYWMTRDSAAVLPTADPLDPAVTFVLYDVDPTHAGSATFVAKDSATQPLTQSKANELLELIGAKADVFPTPQAFTSPAESQLTRFAQNLQSLPSATRPECVAGFSLFRGEFEHTTCQDGPFLIQYGWMNAARMNSARFSFNLAPDNATSWVDRASDTGPYVLSARSKRRLYWENVRVPGVYGVISAGRQGVTEADMMREFTKVQGVAATFGS